MAIEIHKSTRLLFQLLRTTDTVAEEVMGQPDTVAFHGTD